MLWAELFKRTFGLDPLHCPLCGGRVSLEGTFAAIMGFARGWIQGRGSRSTTSADGSPPLYVRIVRSPRDNAEPVIFVTTLGADDGYSRALRWEAGEH